MKPTSSLLIEMALVTSPAKAERGRAILYARASRTGSSTRGRPDAPGKIAE